MKHIIKFTIMGLFVSCLLVACSDDESQQEVDQSNENMDTDQKESHEDKSNEKETDKEDKGGMDKGSTLSNAPSLPDNYQELANREQGKYSTIHPDINEEGKNKTVERFEELPKLGSKPSEQTLDQYYAQLLSLVQQDYKGPQEAIENLRFQTLGMPDNEDSRYQFKEHLNVEVILDASGSMAQNIGNQSKMEIAKNTITDFVEQLPKEAKVGVRVYGHKGSNADEDKQISCESSEMVYPLSEYRSTDFSKALKEVSPTGWTPITLALNEAKKDLASFNGEQHTNIIYLVSDGVATCDGNPIQAAKDLYQSNVKPIVNVIGFNVDQEGQQQLKDLAKQTEGLYENVQDESGLQKELEKVNDIAERWKNWKEDNTEEMSHQKIANELDIFNYISQEESKSSHEATMIDLILSNLKEKEYIEQEAYSYLKEKNDQYHEWIRAEIDSFEKQLDKLNQKSYKEALKRLEEKYQQNTG